MRNLLLILAIAALSLPGCRSEEPTADLEATETAMTRTDTAGVDPEPEAVTGTIVPLEPAPVQPVPQGPRTPSPRPSAATPPSPSAQPAQPDPTPTPTPTPTPAPAPAPTREAEPPPTTEPPPATSTAPSRATAARVPKTHTVDHDGVMHAPGAETPVQRCGACHGKDLRGGKIASTSCFACHERNW